METKQMFETIKNTPGELLNDVATNKPLPENLTAHTAEEDLFNSVNNDINGLNEGQRRNDYTDFTPGNSGQNSVNLGRMVNAPLVVDLADLILPAIFVIVIQKTQKRTVSKSRFKFSASEKETLKPVLENYLNSINFDMGSPVNALMITLALIYGSKTIDVINEPRPENERQQAAVNSNINEGVKTPRRGQFTSGNQPANRGRKPNR